MSRKDQEHHHRWQRRVKDWLVVPHSLRAPREITKEELSLHHTAQDCWVAIDGFVYDVTSFLPHHPGGPRIIVDFAGRDCSASFASNHLNVDAMAVIPGCRIGPLVTDEAKRVGVVVSAAVQSGLFQGVDEKAIALAAAEAVSSGGSDGEISADASLLEVFSLMDKDKSGKVPRTRIATFLTNAGCAGSEAERLVAALPELISAAEFVALVERMQ